MGVLTPTCFSLFFNPSSYDYPKDSFGKAVFLLCSQNPSTYHEVIPLEKVGAIKLMPVRQSGTK